MVRARLTDREILAQIPAARRRGKALPRALVARYDPAMRSIAVVMTNGATLSLPVAVFPELRAASAREVSEVRLDPAGWGLEWPRLDVDCSVGRLAELAVGRNAVLRAAAAAAGSVRTPAKARAARLNGRKGGRPRKASA